jgi:hypothetical protein
MSVRNLVIDIPENASATAVQARLDEAAEDGYFLVNVVGRLAFLRTTVTPQKPDSRRVEDTKAAEFLRANLGKPDTAICTFVDEAVVKVGTQHTEEKAAKVRALIEEFPDANPRELEAISKERGFPTSHMTFARQKNPKSRK